MLNNHISVNRVSNDLAEDVISGFDHIVFDNNLTLRGDREFRGVVDPRLRFTIFRDRAVAATGVVFRKRGTIHLDVSRYHMILLCPGMTFGLIAAQSGFQTVQPRCSIHQDMDFGRITGVICPRRRGRRGGGRVYIWIRSRVVSYNQDNPDCGDEDDREKRDHPDSAIAPSAIHGIFPPYPRSIRFSCELV